MDDELGTVATCRRRGLLLALVFSDPMCLCTALTPLGDRFAGSNDRSVAACYSPGIQLCLAHPCLKPVPFRLCRRSSSD
jgi:hypothetical protein